MCLMRAVLLFILLPLVHVLAEDDAPCLQMFQSSITDPGGFLSNWNFKNSSAGYVCNFNGVQCWHDGENKIFSLELPGGLSGEFPKSLKSCKSLQVLDLSNNHFSGPIPSDLCTEMRYLTTLDLSQNSFTGTIPDNLGSCLYLNVLHLQQNKLNGLIPWQIGDLPRLRDLNMSYNNLRGAIPSSFSDRDELNKPRFNATVFEGNAGLCGTPLSKPCGWSSARWAIVGVAAGAVGDLVILCIWWVFFRKGTDLLVRDPKGLHSKRF